MGNGGQFTSCQSKCSFSCTWTKANLLLHEGLNINCPQAQLQPASALGWELRNGIRWQVAAAANTAPAASSTASNCSWVTCAFPWVGVWVAELFLYLPLLSPDCNRIPQAPSSLSKAHSIANAKHCTLAGKEAGGFSFLFFSLSKFLKPYLPSSCIAHHTS